MCKFRESNLELIYLIKEESSCIDIKLIIVK
jgi:hypothetical protein